ncbi:phosphonate C-P lyase system protein PhnH [Roseibium sediminis]|uniref:phosphonate C-P lyase system protein PhnH n=1 Tax=Roseibium sediminis TaxID=1775174 RepID=UPI00123E334A|nr:phosphonate C-P lyase system protein PhnH [Roseibium sediminis]
MLATGTAVDGGFSNQVLDAQIGFAALMNALSRPGTLQSPGIHVVPPSPLSAMTAIVALTLCDADTVVWLDETVNTSAVRDWLAFHTGTAITAEKELAQFAILDAVRSVADLQGFAAGSQEYPDRSTSIILQVAGFSSAQKFQLSGPGIKEVVSFAPEGLPEGFPDFWAANRALFPRGVDLIFTSKDQLAALPRTTRIDEKLGGHDVRSR